MTETLKELATLIPNDIERRKLGHKEWIEGSIDLCVHLAKARKLHTADTVFGQWCADNGFGEDVIGKDERAGNVAMGREPEALHNCLVKTQRTSLRTIYTSEFSRFRKIAKPPKPGKQEPSTMTRREKTVSQKTHAVDFAKQRATQGLTCNEFEVEFDMLHEAASRTICDLKAQGILVPNGEKRVTKNGGKAEVLVHRDFVTDAMRATKKDKIRGRKPSTASKPAGPINRASRPLYLIENLPREVTGYPAPEVANEINPETGRTRAQDYVWQRGHGQMPQDQWNAMNWHQCAVRLAPQLRDLMQAMKGFLRTPAPQADDVVPMDPAAFIAGLQSPNTTGGPQILARVEKALAELKPVRAMVGEYITRLEAALAALPTAPTASPVIDAATLAASETSTKH